jgi:putative transposase
MQLLVNDKWRKWLADSIDVVGTKHRFELLAFVFMPEHVHLLVNPLEPKPNIDKYLASIKQPFSSRVKKDLKSAADPLLKTLTIRERPGKTVFRYWQEGPGYDRNLRKPETILSSIDYFHKNPVERKLVVRAIDWKWSSARLYLCPDEPIDPDLPIVIKLPWWAH